MCGSAFVVSHLLHFERAPLLMNLCVVVHTLVAHAGLTTRGTGPSMRHVWSIPAAFSFFACSWARRGGGEGARGVR